MLLKLVLTLMLALLAVGCGGRPPSDPAGIAKSEFASGSSENMIIEQRQEGDTYYVERNYFPFAKNRTEVLMSFVDFAQAIFERSPEINRVSVTTSLPFDDNFGNLTWKKASVIEMTRTTADRINWDIFLLSNLPKVTDSYWEAPFLRD